MKKFLLGMLAAVTLAASASATTYTTRYSLAKPADGSTSWGSLLRDNMDTIDAQLYIASNGVVTHLADTVGAHAATAISATVGGTTCTTSDTVQEWLDCLDTQFGTITGGTVVNLAGTQTITGLKTFSALLAANGGISLIGPLTWTGPSDGILHIASGTISSSAIVNADVDAAAAIARTKLASGSNSHVLINSGAGVMSSEAQLANSRGGTGQDMSASTGVVKVAAGTFSASALNLSTDTASTALPTSKGGTGQDFSASSGLLKATAGTVSATTASLTADVSGVLPVANGGTNSNAALNNNRVMKSSAGTVIEAAAITANRALTSDANGIPVHSAVTDTELGYVSGVSSALQTQLNAKQTTTLTSGNVLVGNGSNVATSVAFSGAITNDNAGVTTYAGTVPLNKGGTGQTTKAPAFDALSPMTTSGDMIYGGASGTGTRLPKGTDGQVIKQVAGIPAWSEPPSGEKNFVTGSNANAEVDVGTWACYADAAGTSPVDGTGGSPNITFTRSADTALMDTGLFLYTKDAANRQGQGCAYSFTIDAGYKAKVLQIEFEYILSSGTFAAGDASTDSAMTVWILDVTNSIIIQPTTFKLFSNSTTGATRFISNFQSASNSTSYRLILHNGNTAATAYTMKLDDVKVKPSQYVYGTPITDWQAYTPAFTGYGTVVTQSFFHRKVGDTLQVRGTFTAATSTGVEARVSIPYTTSDSTKLDTLELCGKWNNPTQSASFFSAGTVLCERSVAYVTFGAETSTLDGVTKQNGNAFTASGDTMKLFFQVPIAGWSSSVQTSDQGDSRVVALQVNTSTARTINNTSPTLIYETVVKDSHGSYNAATGAYTIPVSGTYRVSGCYYEAAVAHTANHQTALLLYKNGSIVKNIASSRAGHTTSFSQEGCGSTQADFAGGDTLTIRGYADTATTLGASAPTLNHVEVERLSQASLISATETVAARYTSLVGQSISNADANNTILYGTKDYDTHSAFDTGTGRFTAPVAGKYRVSTSMMFASAAWTAGNRCLLYLFKNGAAVNHYMDLPWVFASVTLELFVKGSTTVNLLAGDYIHINLIQNSSGAKSLSAGIDRAITIERIGM